MRTVLNTAGILALVLLVFAGVGCKSDSSNPYGSPTAPSSTPATNPPTNPPNNPPNNVVMSGMTFNPATITVKVGTTITWVNNDAYAHTSTSDSGLWDSGNIAGHGSATHQFNAPGTYPYHCTYHSAMGMKGTVIVQ